MKLSSSPLRQLGIVAVAFITVAACGGTTTTTTAGCTAATATSAADCGGIDALVTAAKAEGKLNIIAVPPDWLNYGDIVNSFTAKYGIKVTSANPNGSSQEEIDAVNNLAGTSSAPDTLDIGMKQAVKYAALFAPYKPQTWADIPTAQKEAAGLWKQSYGGFMAIGYDPSKVPAINSIADLLGPAFKSKVGLSGNATISNQALNGVIMAALANGGSVDDVSKGVDWFHQLKVAGNWVPVIGTAATVKAGQTSVLFEWDYLSSSHGKDVSGWKVFLPSNAVVGGYYAATINKQAPHPAAARLWQEYLFSDYGQNTWLKGGARPVRQAAMEKSGKLDAAAAAALPKIAGTPVFPTPDQLTAAGAYVSANWAKATG